MALKNFFKKIHSLRPFPWKQSVWQNPDQERTNQNALIFTPRLPRHIKRSSIEISIGMPQSYVGCESVALRDQERARSGLYVGMIQIFNKRFSIYKVRRVDGEV